VLLEQARGRGSRAQREASGSAPGDPQGSVLGPAFFKFFISDLDEESEHPLGQFAAGPELGGVVDPPVTLCWIQRALARLQSWAQRNLMRFNQGKGRVLPLGRNNPRHQDRLGGPAGSSSAERDWECWGTTG